MAASITREFSAAPYSLFDQLDLDHDGKLTPKELQRAGAKPRDANAHAADQPQDTGEHRPPPRRSRRRIRRPMAARRRNRRFVTGLTGEGRPVHRPPSRVAPFQGGRLRGRSSVG